MMITMIREHKGKLRCAAISREGDMALTCGQVSIIVMCMIMIMIIMIIMAMNIFRAWQSHVVKSL